MPDISALLEEFYAERGHSGADAWSRCCVEVPDLADALRAAAWSRDAGGRKHYHQHRLPDPVLRETGERLAESIEEFGRCRSFHDLYGLIGRRRVRGFGDLAVYDAALRIGHRLGLLPDRVYLHAGVAVGARYYGIEPADVRWATPEELPAELRTMEPFLAEEFLCLYKDGALRNGRERRC